MRAETSAQNWLRNDFLPRFLIGRSGPLGLHHFGFKAAFNDPRLRAIETICTGWMLDGPPDEVAR